MPFEPEAAIARARAAAAQPPPLPTPVDAALRIAAAATHPGYRPADPARARRRALDELVWWHPSGIAGALEHLEERTDADPAWITRARILLSEAWLEVQVDGGS